MYADSVLPECTDIGDNVIICNVHLQPARRGSSTSIMDIIIPPNISVNDQKFLTLLSNTSTFTEYRDPPDEIDTDSQSSGSSTSGSGSGSSSSSSSSNSDDSDISLSCFAKKSNLLYYTYNGYRSPNEADSLITATALSEYNKQRGYYCFRRVKIKCNGVTKVKREFSCKYNLPSATLSYRKIQKALNKQKMTLLLYDGVNNCLVGNSSLTYGAERVISVYKSADDRWYPGTIKLTTLLCNTVCISDE
jgi:hypothetical protein